MDSTDNFELADSIDRKQLDQLLESHKLTSEDFSKIEDILGRDPTFAEFGVFSAMWSEHCSYKSSKFHLKKLPTDGKNVVVGPGENAGAVRFEEDLCIVFKMESHNHPSYIDPFQGASTGVGGILRDVFCMGARPIANLNGLRFGERSHPRTAYLVDRVVKGIGDYGNCVGIPTVNGSIGFDSSYNGNCLVNAMTVGLAKESEIFKGFASGLNNLIVYLGSATGRDGIHGATMASDNFSEQELSSKTTIQVGDPFAEKKLLEATLECLRSGLVVGLQDMGAAGLTSSVFEMADRASNGVALDLGDVPVRAPNMTCYELLLSESQERMLFVVEPDNWQSLVAILEKWELEYAVIGRVTDTKRVQITYNGRLEVDVPIAPLTDKAPVYERPFHRRSCNDKVKLAESRELSLINELRQRSVEDCCAGVLAYHGSKEWVFDQYDHTIGNRTLIGPSGGGAAVLAIREFPNKGLAVASAGLGEICRRNPFLGAAHTVLKCFRMLAATGAEPLGITDCLNYGNPEIPSVMGDFVQGVEGIAEACNQLEIPVVSGNVSLYNQTGAMAVNPTPMIGMVGKVDDLARSPTSALDEGMGGFVYLLASRYVSFDIGCSWLMTSGFGFVGDGINQDLDVCDSVPAISYTEEQTAARLIRGLVRTQKGQLVIRDIGQSGLLPTVLKVVLPARAGLEIDLSHYCESHCPDIFSAYFGFPGMGYLIISSEEIDKDALVGKEPGIGLHRIGRVVTESVVLVEGASLDYDKLVTAWRPLMDTNDS